MARQTKYQKVDENKAYVIDQMDKFLWKHYKLVLSDVPVYIDRDKEFKRIMGKLEFGENGEPSIILSHYLLQMSKNKILEWAFHECVHYALWKKGYPYKDGEQYFEDELKKHGLPSTGGLVEGWVDLHVYICSGCKKPLFMKKDKIPKKNCPDENGMLSGCCRAPIKYKGKVRYTNKKLKEIASKIKVKDKHKIN